MAKISQTSWNIIRFYVDAYNEIFSDHRPYTLKKFADVRNMSISTAWNIIHYYNVINKGKHHFPLPSSKIPTRTFPSPTKKNVENALYILRQYGGFQNLKQMYDTATKGTGIAATRYESDIRAERYYNIIANMIKRNNIALSSDIDAWARGVAEYTANFLNNQMRNNPQEFAKMYPNAQAVDARATNILDYNVKLLVRNLQTR